MFLLALYWICALGALAYVLLALVVGGLVEFGEMLFEPVSDFFEGIAQSIENIGGDPETLTSLHEGGTDHVSGDHQTHTSLLSFRMILLFLGAFGVGGLIGVGAGLSSTWALIPAVGLGLAGGYPLFLLTDYLFRQQTFLASNPREYVGRIGKVTISIPEKGIGEVQLEVELLLRKYPARSKDGVRIPLHASVQVISYEGGELTVVEI